MMVSGKGENNGLRFFLGSLGLLFITISWLARCSFSFILCTIIFLCIFMVP